MIELKVGKRIKIKKDQLSVMLADRLRDMYKYSFKAKIFKWDGHRKVISYETQRIQTVIENQDEFLVPRGSYDRLLKFLETEEYDVYFENNLTKVSLSETLDNKLKLYDYQEKALNKLLKYDNGILEAPCGAGKTIIALELMSRIQQTTLILVHTSLIFRQWEDQLRKNLGIQDIGTIGLGLKNPRPITIAMVQTLHKLSSSSFEKLRNVFGCIISDECHHIPAYTFLKIIANFSPYYLYGLSATPKRKDGKEFLSWDFLGDVRSKISDSTLVKAKRITDVKVTWLKSDERIVIDEFCYMIQALILSQKRIDLIVEAVKNAVEDKHFVLILSERVIHCKRISKSLHDKGIQNICVVEKLSKEVKQMLLATKKEQTVFVATMSIAREGLDIPELSCIVLATPSNNEFALKQMIGRGRRSKNRKTLVVDISDHRNPIFRAMAKNRFKWYRDWKFRQHGEFDELVRNFNVPDKIVYGPKKVKIK